MRRILVLLVVTACSGTDAASGGAPADGGWTTADYVRAGVPDPGHPWAADELTRAAEAIAREAGRHPEHLPGSRGRSAAIFARLVERASPASSSDPIRTEFIDHATRSEAYVRLLHLYQVAHPGAHDTIEIMGATMWNNALLLQMTDPFLRTLPAAELTPARLAGVQKMRVGMRAMFVGALMMATPSALPDEDRRELVAAVAKALPLAYPQLEPDAQQAVRAQLDTLAGAATGDLRDDVVAAERQLPAAAP